jgi:amino acid transporter
MLGEIGFGTGLLLINVANSFFPDGNPGGNAVDATLLLMFFVIFEAFIFYHVVRSVGRTGGDYVWMSRNIGPVLGERTRPRLRLYWPTVLGCVGKLVCHVITRTELIDNRRSDRKQRFNVLLSHVDDADGVDSLGIICDRGCDRG